MGNSIGELLDNPVLYWNWLNDSGARAAAVSAVHALNLLVHVGPGPTSATDIARRSGHGPELIRRLVEFLAAEGVLAVDSKGCFLPTERSRLLQSIGSVNWTYGTVNASSVNLGKAIQNGNRPDAWAITYGKPIFEALGANPDWGRMFGETMGFSTAATEPKIFELHQFKPFKLAVDIGGSHGNLMMRLLAAHPAARGIVFDLPETADQARAPIAASAMGNRIEVVGGSFFENVPAGGDLYLMKHILHDWSDDECRAILKTVRAAMQPGARLAVIERLIPDEYRPATAYSFDIVMMLCSSGRERRLGEFKKMFQDTGFAFDRVTRNPEGPSVIEGVAT